MFNMIMKLLIARGPIILIPIEATQDEATQDKPNCTSNYIMINNSYSYNRGVTGFYQKTKSLCLVVT